MISKQYENIINNTLTHNLQVRDIKDGWKEVKKEKDFTLYSIKYQENDIKLSKIEGIIPANFEKVAKYYHECFDVQKSCREMCDKLVNLETIDQDTCIYLFKTKGKLLVSAREILGVQHRKKLNPNEIVIIRGSIPDHPHAPINKDAVRGEQKVFSIFLTKINDNSTKLTTFALMDPKVSVPTSMINAMIEKQVTIFNNDLAQILKM